MRQRTTDGRAFEARLCIRLTTPLVVRVPVPSGARLTPRQLQVVAASRDCRTNAAIARRLGTSRKTVVNHWTAILARLGARNRTHALCLCYALAAAEGSDLCDDPASGIASAC